MGYIYLAVAIAALTVLGVTYKLSDTLRCNRLQVNLLLFAFGAIALLIWAWQSHGLVFSTKAALIGAGVGIVSYYSVKLFREAVAIGRISTSWTILQLSVVIPVIASILIWREPPSLRHWAGLLATAAAIVLLGIDMGRTRE